MSDHPIRPLNDVSRLARFLLSVWVAGAVDLLADGGGFEEIKAGFGRLHTIAGRGAIDSNGGNDWDDRHEGGSALEAELSEAHNAQADVFGNVYIADKDSHSIRVVRPDGRIWRLAGTNVAGDGDDVPQRGNACSLNGPNGLHVQPDGVCYIFDAGNRKVRRVAVDGSIVTVFQDPAASTLGRGLWVHPSGSPIYYASGAEVREWKAGSGSRVLAGGFSGGLANLTVSPAGELVVTDRSAHSVYRVNLDGSRVRIAGNGSASGGGDGQAATDTGSDGNLPAFTGFRPWQIVCWALASIRVFMMTCCTGRTAILQRPCREERRCFFVAGGWRLETMREVFGSDCYSPQEIAERVENVGVTKANLPLLSQVALGVLAGGFIGLGAMFFTLVVSDTNLGFAVGRVLGGLAFSLGLILVVVAGAELFTGNNLLVMATVAGRISTFKLLRNLVVTYFANFIGAAGLAALVAISGHWQMGNSTVGGAAVGIAAAKCAMPFGEAFLKGVLCNVLVCLAVWLAMAGRTVSDKVLAIVFPVTAFVACGFEHSVANMYLIPCGIFLRESVPIVGATAPAGLGWSGLARNLVPVTLGNLVGGAGMVGLVYWVIYRREAPRVSERPPSP